jgi:hypothetical protein
MLDTGPLAVPAVFAHTTPVMATEAQKGSFLTQHFAQGRRVAMVGMVSTIL